MSRALALALAALLSACASETTLVFVDGPSDASWGRPGASVGPCRTATQDPALLELLELGIESWSDVGIEGACAAEVAYAGREELAELCGFPGRPIDGCAKQATGRVLVGDWLSRERQQAVVNHELGHLLAGFVGHLACQDRPGDAIMCPTGGPQWPTERDAEFVQGHHMADVVGYD